MKRSLKHILLSLGLISLGVTGYSGYTLWRVLSIGTAYQAKQFCSGVFVSGRTPESIFNQDILAEIEGLSALEQSIVKSIQVTIDRPQQSVTASIFGLVKHFAIFRSGLGCTLVIDTSATELRAQVKSMCLAPLELDKWQFLEQKERETPEINQKQLKVALDSVLHPQQHTRAVVVVYRTHLTSFTLVRYSYGKSHIQQPCRTLAA